jgi:hypothetical protein
MSRPYLTYHLPTASSGYCGFTALSQSKEKPYSLLLSSLAVRQPACLLQKPDGVENDNVEIHGWSFVWLSAVTIDEVMNGYE